MSRIAFAIASLSAIGVASLALGGCVIVHDSNDHPVVTHPDHEDAVDIDVSVGELKTDPGSGVSIIVEYAGNGRWNADMTCDTEKSGYACSFDVYARASGIRVIDDRDLESGDYVEEYGEQLHAAFTTDIDTDGFSFDTPLGEAVELEVYLDGDNAHPFVFWIGDGAQHNGAPTNPTLFIPPVGQ